jgi:hypothetical protein
MATQLQLRRGTSGQNDVFTGAAGEVTVDTTNNVIRVHDGISAGGIAQVSAAGIQTLSNKTLSNTTMTGNLVPSANLTYNLGSNTSWFGTFYGISSQAKYADLAENYTADATYSPGTVLVFGGANDVTTTTISHDTRVAGIVSTNPAYLMNASSGDIAVALTGRVPCRVQGPVNKGTVLVTSNQPGIAQAIDMLLYAPGCVIGKSLQVIEDDSIQTIEVVVGRF